MTYEFVFLIFIELNCPSQINDNCTGNGICISQWSLHNRRRKHL